MIQDMLSDTHCHLFSYYKKEELPTILEKIKNELCFIQDIGTKPDDFPARFSLAKELLSEIPSFYHFSLGIWPDAQYIACIDHSLAVLEEHIVQALNQNLKIALGECGLDRYWNGNTVAHKEKGGTNDIAGEELLFERQLRLAKKYNLPVIVHSRDAFADTLKIIDTVGYNNGVIHCFAYGKEEANAFLERGWHISFSGNCTYPTTKAKRAAMSKLVESIPDEKLLLETDAPYLAPTPYRGSQNTPLLVKYVYDCVASMRATDIQSLSHLVYENATKLFGTT